jgi:hypothetical protein
MLLFPVILLLLNPASCGSHYWLVLFSRPVALVPHLFQSPIPPCSIKHKRALRYGVTPSEHSRPAHACLLDKKASGNESDSLYFVGLSALCSVTYFVRRVSRFSCLGSSERRKTAKGRSSGERGPLSADVLYVDLASKNNREGHRRRW